jgi:hypothetical protein
VYLFSVAPKITEADTTVGRILRSFSPAKYIYPSDAAVRRCLESSGYAYTVVRRLPLWYFHSGRLSHVLLDLLHLGCGDRLFDGLERLNKRVWPRYSGSYLVIRKE